MAATHKNKRNKSGSKRKFRKVTKKGTQNKQRRRTLKKRGGTTNSPDKDELLHELMPDKPLNSTRRAFSKINVKTLKYMTPEDREATYNNWRNEEANRRKRLRLISRQNNGESEDMPNIFYDNNGSFDPYNPDDPWNDLRVHDNWQNEVPNIKNIPKKRIRKQHVLTDKHIANIGSFPIVHYDNNNNHIFDPTKPHDPLNDLHVHENWQNQVPYNDENILYDENIVDDENNLHIDEININENEQL